MESPRASVIKILETSTVAPPSETGVASIICADAVWINGEKVWIAPETTVKVEMKGSPYNVGIAEVTLTLVARSVVIADHLDEIDNTIPSDARSRRA